MVKKCFSDFKLFYEEFRKSGCYNVIRVVENVIGIDVVLSVDLYVVVLCLVSL